MLPCAAVAQLGLGKAIVTYVILHAVSAAFYECSRAASSIWAINTSSWFREQPQL